MNAPVMSSRKVDGEEGSRVAQRDGDGVTVGCCGYAVDSCEEEWVEDGHRFCRGCSMTSLVTRVDGSCTSCTGVSRGCFAGPSSRDSNAGQSSIGAAAGRKRLHCR